MRKIHFEDNKFDAVICLNAELPDKLFFDKLKGAVILAADGAAIRLLKQGVFADMVIGDLDSFLSQPESDLFDKNKIFENKSQDSNDFEKTLNYCVEKKYKNILVTGIHGGEIEHTLNNQSVFNRYSQIMNLCIYDAERYGIPIQSSVKFESYAGEIISLIPQPSANVTTKNLKWELKDYNLTFGKNEGARNMSVGNKVEIELNEGFLMLFIESKAPRCPIFL